MRVVDPEDADAVGDPVLEDPLARLPAASRARSSSPSAVAARSRAGRCPGTSSAGSRRSGWCRRDGGGTTRGARCTQGGRASTAARSRARPRGPVRRARTRRRRSRRSCRARGPPRCGRRPRRRSPTGCRDRPARPRGCCPDPCGGWCRSGGSAAGTRRRTPSRRRRRAARSQPADRLRTGGTARTRRSSAPTAGRPRPTPGALRIDPVGRARAAGRNEGSCQPVGFTSRARTAARSTAAPTTSSCRPTRDGSKCPAHSSLPSGCSGSTAQASSPAPTGRQRTQAASGSWPSRKIDAATGTRSPTAAFAGNAPVAVRGRTSSMVIRPSTTPSLADRPASSVRSDLGVDRVATLVRSRRGWARPGSHGHGTGGSGVAVRSIG